jgi:2-oxoisovalerate dehydrogenase E1 component
MSVASAKPAAKTAPDARYDWRRVARTVLLSRALDELEEKTLVPAKKVLYQFSARGHDMAQVLLGTLLDDKNDAICGYYRSRPILLSLGVDPADALSSNMMRSGGYSGGRDIGAVFNFPNAHGPSALPMCGGVGAQYAPTAGWAQAIVYRHTVLKDKGWDRAIAVALGGDASCATGGFWSALTIATTLKLPMLFFIEDNGYGISVPGAFQTPGADIAANLASFKNLRVTSGDGADPAEAARLIAESVDHVRGRKGPALLRLVVPRLEGHSAQDTQTYKPEALVKDEWARDPLPRLKAYLAGEDWRALEAEANAAVADALKRAEARPAPDANTIATHIFFDGEMQAKGGQWCETGGHEGYKPPAATAEPETDGQRINMGAAIRRTLETELAANPRVCVFGEDVGPKGGVHAVTLGLQERFGEARVFDTSLNEDGIIGRAVGMALAGLVPAPEIQFRKYADSAAEQLHDCGTMRWRTNNRFAAPVVVRMPVGFFKCGDPWHSQTNEVEYVHNPGWMVAVPSNAADAVGLLRAALRGNDPVVFFEHRAMLDAAWARRPWPGDDYMVPFGRASITMAGDALTIVTWGAMVERCEAAATASGRSVEVIDLRTLMPWDRDAVLESVKRTRRCLVVHEDLKTGGFGGEIAATVAEECFLSLDAPVSRLCMADVPSPHNPELLDSVVPSVDDIRAKIDQLVSF